MLTLFLSRASALVPLPSDVRYAPLLPQPYQRGRVLAASPADCSALEHIAALEKELEATRQQLQLSRKDNAALLRRLADERAGAAEQLESTVVYWQERLAEAA